MNGLGALRARPILVVVLLGLGMVLVWLVLTTTLPFALARSAPDLALRLNPNFPPALLIKADRYRQAYLELLTSASSQQGAPTSGADTSAETQSAEGRSAETGSGSVGRFSAPVTPESAADKQARIGALREKIRALAERTLRNAPLNAKAYRLLGEVAEDADTVRRYMKVAARLSRREPIALFWLLQDSVAQGAHAETLTYADSLLRTEPSLARYVVSYLAVVNEADGGRQQLTAKLSENPDWRGRFFGQLPRVMRNPVSALKLMIALKEAGHAPTTNELRPFLDHLMRQGQHQLAYNAWLQLLSPDELKAVGAVNNGDFETQPTGLAFDWTIARPRNAIAEIALDPQDGTNRALAVRFSGRRAGNVQVSQTLVLVPGTYDVSGDMRGKIQGKRGMRWRVVCLGKKSTDIGRSDMLFASEGAWQPFTFRIDVPNDAPCPAQRLVLVHDARSASEELVNGTLWFDNVRMERATTTAQPIDVNPTVR